MLSQRAILRIFGAGFVFVGAVMLTLDGFGSAGAVLMLLGGGLLWLSQRAMADGDHQRNEVSWKARRRSTPLPAEGETPKAEKAGDEVLPPYELRAGDVVVDDQGGEWELMGQPAKSVRTRDYFVMVRRVDRRTDIRVQRWQAHERVKVQRS